MVISLFAKAQADANSRLYELRTYYAPEGKLENLLNRFRQHTLKLFYKHNMRTEGFWVPMDNKENNNARYIAQVWLAINHYSELLDKPIIIVGDFNSNQIWDKEKRIANHSDVVKLLSDKSIESLYHKMNSENQGKETQPTFFLHRNKEKPYHLDYCFVSEKFWSKEFSVTIGNFDEWIKLSDHLPIEIEFK